jgi:hypothetical protein
MTTPTADTTTAPIHLGYPSLRKAAEIVGVNVSSLSRRDLDVIEMGAQQKKLSARTAMEEAAYFNRRDRNEVAADLVELAEDQCPEVVDAIEEEITEYMQDREAGTGLRPDADWLAEAEAFLPRDLFERVRRVYEQADAAEDGDLSGPPPG